MTGYKSPPRRRTKLVQPTPRNAIRRCLLSDYDLLGTWQAVGAKYDLSGGMVYRVAVDGYRPQKKAIRAKLNRVLPRPPRKPRVRYKPLFRFVWAAFLGSQLGRIHRELQAKSA